MGSFCCIGRLERPVTGTDLHHHELTWEICCYRTGSGTSYIAGREIPFSPGMIVVIPPRMPHRERSPDGFTTDYLHVYGPDLPFAGLTVLHDDPCGIYRSLADQLERESTVRAPGWSEVCEQLTALMLRYLERWLGGDAQDDLVARVKHRLTEGMHDPDFSIGEALADLGCTADHARRRFRRATGRTPAAFLALLRLRAAKQAMIADCNVRMAAERSGIPDPYYFSRLFRRHEGATPTAWLASRRASA